MPPAMAYKPGDLLGELRIEREIGRGAWGIVYLAEDTLLARKVALKVLPESLAQAGPDIQQRVLAEARIVGALQSPNVVTLYRLREGPHGSWIQEMEFAEGGSLETRLKPDKPLAQDEAVRIFRGVCSGLQVAHEQRIIHGDIKPANVLFGKGDVVKLADFGLSRLLGRSGTSLSLHGEFIGTPEYMAPEVLTGHKTYPTSDLWSAAALFYRLLTGRKPFPAEEIVQLFVKVQTEEPEPLGDGVPVPLANFVLRCLAKTTDERPSSAQAALDELDASLGARVPIPAPVESKPTSVSTGGPRTNCQGEPGLLGRDSELFDLVQLFSDRDETLCTITGPAGVGKTSIARELCKRLSEKFEGGAWFVDLQEVRDPEGVGQAVARTLNAQPGEGESPIQVVSDVLRFRTPLVLVLDNFEQLAAHADATVGEWMRSSPHVRFVGRRLGWVRPRSRRSPVCTYSWTARARCSPVSRSTTPSPATSRGSASGSTGSRWPSNWPPRACACSSRARSPTSWARSSSC
jgi:serine/threonine-protein kinase